MEIDFGVYIAMLRRRWLLILAPIVLLTPLAVAVAYVLPPVYESTARILVDPQQIPAALAQSTVTTNAAQRVAFIEQQLMTRQNLLAIADRFGVYARRRDLSPTEIVELMRAATTIDATRGRVTGVNISFRADDAGIAARVANEFVTLLLEQNIQARNTLATETSNYFRSEVRRLSDAMAATETAIAAFKIENQQALPDSLGFRRTEVANLEQRIFQREIDLRELQTQREELTAAIAAGQLTVAAAGPTPEAAELQRLRAALARQRAVYTDTHPQIRSLLSRINALEGVLESTGGAPSDAFDPEERARAVLANLDEQIAGTQERLAFETRRIEELKASIARTPSVELELNSLTRELGSLRAQHGDAVLKLAQAETGERLEVSQQAERFEVIEQPQRPTAPISPNRPLVATAGFVGAVGLGFGLALLVELINPVLRTAADLERRLELRPIAVIPYIQTRREALWRKWSVRILLTGLFIVVPALLYAVDQFYLPLEVVLRRVLEMTGLDSMLSLVRLRLDR